ncbi:MAG: hypothetical protein LBE76_08140 [Nitrososphaerota archaeon]|nr:hypothetical protein [Nitrososphaerota archaeon]
MNNNKYDNEQTDIGSPLQCKKCGHFVNEIIQDDVGTQFYNCPNCNTTLNIKKNPLLHQQQHQQQQEKSVDNAVEDEQPQVLEHINNIEDPRVAGKPVVFESVISSTSIAYNTPAQVKVILQEEDQDEVTITPEIAIDDPVNLGLFDVTQETQNNRLIKFLKQQYQSKTKIVSIRQMKSRTVYKIRVRPPVFTIEKQDNKLIDDKGYEYKHLDLYVASNVQLNFQPSSLIRATGIPFPHPKNQKTTFLAYKIESLEDNLCYDLQKIQCLLELFKGKNVFERLQWILENFEHYSRIHSRQNIATAALLTFFTPLYVQLDDNLQRGWGIGVVVGDTTTGKSETVKKMSKLFKAGLVISAETASTVGLTGAATQTDRDGWFIDWGFLPLMDRKLLAIDGSHKLSASCWAALAEAERSGVLSIAKAAKNTTNARARQIRIYNAVDKNIGYYSTKSLNSFLHPVQALTTVLDATSIARVDVAVFSDQRDVTPEDVNKSTTKTPDALLEDTLPEILKWTWSNNTKVNWSDPAKNLLLTKATELHNKFYYEAIPLVTIDVKFKIARLSVALAYCTLSVNEEFSCVTVTEEHVKGVIDFLTNEYTRTGLGVLAQEHKFEKLTLEEVKHIFLSIQSQVNLSCLSEILRYIVNENRITKSSLQHTFQLADKTEIRPLFFALQNEGLIKSSKGFYSTPKLIEAYKLTNGFATLAIVATLKKEPPPPLTLTNYTTPPNNQHSYELIKPNMKLDVSNMKVCVNETQKHIIIESITPPAEPCQCGILSVTRVITTPTHESYRVCQNCFDEFKQTHKDKPIHYIRKETTINNDYEN